MLYEIIATDTLTAKTYKKIRRYKYYSNLQDQSAFRKRLQGIKKTWPRH